MAALADCTCCMVRFSAFVFSSYSCPHLYMYSRLVVVVVVVVGREGGRQWKSSVMKAFQSPTTNFSLFCILAFFF